MDLPDNCRHYALSFIIIQLSGKSLAKEDVMTKLPKLKVKKDAWKDTIEIQDFEQAKDFPYAGEIIIAVEGRQVNSYEELMQMVEQGRFKNKKYLEVLFLPLITGG
jgi:hypothetical protein